MSFFSSTFLSLLVATGSLFGHSVAVPLHGEGALEARQGYYGAAGSATSASMDMMTTTWLNSSAMATGTAALGYYTASDYTASDTATAMATATGTAAACSGTSGCGNATTAAVGAMSTDMGGDGGGTDTAYTGTTLTGDDTAQTSAASYQTVTVTMTVTAQWSCATNSGAQVNEIHKSHKKDKNGKNMKGMKGHKSAWASASMATQTFAAASWTASGATVTVSPVATGTTVAAGAALTTDSAGTAYQNAQYD